MPILPAVYPDLPPDDTYPTRLAVTRQSDTLQYGSRQIQSKGTIVGDLILFEPGPQTVQVLLLPDGASSTCPLAIGPREPIILEAGWLIAPDKRQRLIRQSIPKTDGPTSC